MVALISIIALGIVLWCCAKLIYNLYLHPLAKFPGPTAYCASPVPLSLAQISGKWHSVTQSAHDKFGPVVRMAPNELYFTSAAAWNDIYGRRQDQPPLPRDPTFFNEMLVDPETMTMANDGDHARIRRSLAPAFSAKSLQEQEPIIQRSIDLLIDQLEARAAEGLSSDLRTWFNYATFDLIGDLAFGETFGCLANSTLHAWVQMVVDYFFAATLLNAVHRFSPLNKILAMLLPASVMEKKRKHTEMALERVRRRANQTNLHRPDFIQHLLKAVESGTITAPEMENQASILILAGSETTSIALTYATYLLVTHPEVLLKLRQELEKNFDSDKEINLISVNQLQYLHAVIQETLRLRPPITNGFPRMVQGQGAVVDGHYLPKGTVVNINHWATYQSSRNFTLPREFHPERWMGVDSRFKDDCKDVFQPFSVGPRNCIGKKFAYDSMKLILARMVWKFDMKLEARQGKQNWLEDQFSYVSWHVPSLDVSLALRDRLTTKGSL